MPDDVAKRVRDECFHQFVALVTLCQAKNPECLHMQALLEGLLQYGPDGLGNIYDEAKSKPN